MTARAHRSASFLLASGVGLVLLAFFLQRRGDDAVVEEVAFDDMRRRCHRHGNGRRVALAEQEFASALSRINIEDMTRRAEGL